MTFLIAAALILAAFVYGAIGQKQPDWAKEALAKVPEKVVAALPIAIVIGLVLLFFFGGAGAEATP
jgi:hypothetical protein